MAFYVFGEITLKSSAWVLNYLENINAFIHLHNGQVLARTTKMNRVEGATALPTNVILMKFPTEADALGFFENPTYQALRQTRLEGSVSIMTLFPEEDMANNIDAVRTALAAPA